ncbi:hypothetical protein G6L26_009320 [Agrobacterium radiobacter]|jgi:hypothetical protein|nr:hypothetical protein [Agrobacterium tumefaciens]KWT83088.1 hypothetical protein ASB65_09510 [Agrobacterium tumefaciens str. B6]MCW8057534.1 hypothetical protein [Agrobacterium tumefaciens]MQB25810.1 hypothetical protein [Agrobacterium tumefaciens]MQB37791.1 hypothetical protein [Agrobacterium tumefaciens]NSZ32847.1 hypothetical protein [Agrobacterium tumefaciens]
MTGMIFPIDQSRFMLIHAPKQFMVLSVILTNRVNKRLRTVMPRNEKPAMEYRGLSIIGSVLFGLTSHGVKARHISSPRWGEASRALTSLTNKGYP